MSKAKGVRPLTPSTLGAWLDFALGLYGRSGLATGQVAASAHDEALYLILHTLGLPLESAADVLAHRTTAAQNRALRDILRRRVEKRIPAAYLTREAWLGGHRFHVDERVIIPRSYFVEIVPQLKGTPARIADACTGSGCLAILLAHHFPQARVAGIDLSAPALAVAKINVLAHRLSRRVSLHRSDLFASVPAGAFDLIVSNPPYEPSALCDALPPEFQKEPRLALDGGADGLGIIRRLLQQARERLEPHGEILIEVGGLRAAFTREFAALQPRWLRTEDGADCVCRIAAANLRRPSASQVVKGITRE